MKDDLISRLAAIDAITQYLGRIKRDFKQWEGTARIILDHVPSAQPDVPDINVGDMISRQAAIETVRKAQSIGQAHRMLAQLPSAQPTCTVFVPVDDCISRQAAIDMLKNRWKKTRHYEGIGDDIAEECELYLKQVPSAQPNVSKEEMVGDTISRQAAIKAICEDGTMLERQGKYTMTMAERKQKDADILDTLPPAQPVEDIHREKEQAYYCGYEDGAKAARSAQPVVIRCKDCKHNPKITWFGCQMAYCSETQRPETAWCWKAERRTDD